MAEFPETSESLILRVQDTSNRTAWIEFEQLYRPVIFRIARARGMQHADAHDLVQQVLLSVAVAIERYEKSAEGTRFRNWLSKVTRNAILKALSRPKRDLGLGGSGVIDVFAELPSPDPATNSLIDVEYRRELFQRAANSVRKKALDATWLAFEMTVLQNTSIERAAEVLGMPTGSVYAARSRIMRKIRDAVRQMEIEEGGE